jgi:hypothetical protein
MVVRLLQKVVPELVSCNTRECPSELGSARLFADNLPHRVPIDVEVREDPLAITFRKP